MEGRPRRWRCSQRPSIMRSSMRCVVEHPPRLRRRRCHRRGSPDRVRRAPRSGRTAPSRCSAPARARSSAGSSRRPMNFGAGGRSRPVDGRRVGARLGQRDERRPLPGRMLPAHALVVGALLGQVGRRAAPSTAATGTRPPSGWRRGRTPPGRRSAARSSPRCARARWWRRRSAAGCVKSSRCISRGHVRHFLEARRDQARSGR